MSSGAPTPSGGIKGPDYGASLSPNGGLGNPPIDKNPMGGQVVQGGIWDGSKNKGRLAGSAGGGMSNAFKNASLPDEKEINVMPQNQLPSRDNSQSAVARGGGRGPT